MALAADTAAATLMKSLRDKAISPSPSHLAKMNDPTLWYLNVQMLP
jgi:hypothetical protein